MKIKGTEGKYSSEPEKAHPTGEFIIVAKLSGHVLGCLASSLSILVKQVGRQTKISLQALDNSICHLVAI